MILILTRPSDPHANLVESMLRERGADVVRFNPSQYPAEASLSTTCGKHGDFRSVLAFDGQRIDLGRVQSVWYRRPESPEADTRIDDARQRAMIEGESQAVFADLYRMLDAAWLPAPPQVIHGAQLKLSQLQVAAALDFELPPTLVTNDPAELRAFHRLHDGNIISKLAGFSFFGTVGDDFCRYTEPVSAVDIGYARSARYCPMIYQAYVPKQVELRITVVGREVFAAEIRSQETNHTRHDWRRYDHGKTPYVGHNLPDDVARQCVDLVAKLGLSYGAIDMIVAPDGRYVFLEINPNGQYLWVEEASGLPISDAICRQLAGDSLPTSPTHPENDFAGAVA